MTYGGVAPTFDTTSSGLVAGDTSSVVSGLTCGATDGNGHAVSGATPVGTYAITCTGGSAANYSITSVAGTLTIVQAAQTITFSSMPPSPAAIGRTYTAAATGGASGNPITFTAGPSTVCASSGTNGATITLVGVGTCTVTAAQAGTENYSAAAPVAQSVVVSFPPLTLALSVTSSPAGAVTTGSTVTAKVTVGNHTTTTQTVRGTATLTYMGSHGSVRLSIPLRLTLTPGQTLSQSTSFTIQSWFPRGSYTLSVTATDGSGDTANSSASLTVS